MQSCIGLADINTTCIPHFDTDRYYSVLYLFMINLKLLNESVPNMI